MIKIAYDHQIFSWQKYGGISRYIAELVRNLGNYHGLQTSIIAPFYVNKYLLSPEVRSHVRGLFVPLRGGRRIAKSLTPALLPLFWWRKEVDVIHETYYSQACRGRGRVRILTIHDMIHELFPAEFAEAAEVSAAKRAAAARADHIICVSETTRRDVVRLLGVESGRTSVIHLGCGIEDSKSPAHKSATVSPCILYVGPRRGYKNFALLLEAFAASSRLKTRFDLVAFGAESFHQEEQREIERLGVTAQVRHVRGGDALLWAHYRAAVAFVYPSRYEGFGIPLLEAMATGCPVACSTATAISEIAGDAGAYFDPDDCSSLRLILERIADEPPYADELRAKGKLRLARYSWARCAAETLATYRRLTKSAA